MKDYLAYQVDIDDQDFVSAIDELPLWSGPFGLKLLDTIELKKNINALDLGCGFGFPLIELAQRLGATCKVYGIDPWETALAKAQLKIKACDIRNVEIVHGCGEEMPFEDAFFDLIVSNNGINNVTNMQQTIRECYRVSKPGAQMVVTLNLEETMIEFYRVLREVLAENNLYNEIHKMKEHIYSKRRPLGEIKDLFTEAGFSIREILHDSFKLRFVDATTMFNHSLIKCWFLDSWKKIPPEKDLEQVFDQVETRLNEKAEKNKEFSLTVPFVTIDCSKGQ
jgi:arsenite methyltransferase